MNPENFYFSVFLRLLWLKSVQWFFERNEMIKHSNIFGHRTAQIFTEKDT